MKHGENELLRINYSREWLAPLQQSMKAIGFAAPTLHSSRSFPERVLEPPFMKSSRGRMHCECLKLQRLRELHREHIVAAGSASWTEERKRRLTCIRRHWRSTANRAR